MTACVLLLMNTGCQAAKFDMVSRQWERRIFFPDSFTIFFACGIVFLVELTNLSREIWETELFEERHTRRPSGTGESLF